MAITTGTVVDGKILIVGPALREGEVVTVVTDDDGADFQLSEWQQDELDAAAAELDRGEFVTMKELFKALSKRD